MQNRLSSDTRLFIIRYAKYRLSEAARSRDAPGTCIDYACCERCSSVRKIMVATTGTRNQHQLPGQLHGFLRHGSHQRHGLLPPRHLLQVLQLLLQLLRLSQLPRQLEWPPVWLATQYAH